MLQKTIQTLSVQGFPQVLRTWGRGRGSAPPLPPVGEALQNLMGGGLKSIQGGAWEGLKMLSRNTCEGVHLIVELPAISLQAFKFTKMNFFTHTFQGF